MMLTCPQPACGYRVPEPAVFCSECGARLGLSPEQLGADQARKLTRALVAQRERCAYGSCAYCGHPCLGRACTAHRPLLKLDPHFQMEGRAA
jgi:hypothetical protein